MKKNKKIIGISICIIVFIGLYAIISTYKNNNKGVDGVNNQDGVNERAINGNLIFIEGKNEFNKGILENVDIIQDNNNSLNNNIKEDTIVLKSKNGKYVKEGTFISEVIDTEDFNKLILSWNAETPEKTYIEVEARAYTNTSQWTEWLSWGVWGTGIERAFKSTACNLAKVDTDTLIIKGDETYANKIQVRVKLYSKSSKVTPILTRITVSYINSENKVIDAFNGDINLSIVEKVIETPKISQMLRDKRIASRICSPTSMTMLLNRLGENLIVEDVAWSSYDYNYDGFGNWVYNVAFAGSLGHQAYVKFGSLEDLKNEIEDGYPVATSVKYTNDIDNDKYPYIENAPLTTSGHLIVVCGFSNKNGEQYVVVNDPAAEDDESVRVEYRLEQFMEAWSNSDYIMYIVH